MAPETLAQVLSKLEGNKTNINPNVLIGFDLMEDAGVYKLNDNLALVQTVDFFTPITDDPYTFGEIAGTNSLSDIYAMGGEALTALSIACFPDDLDPQIMAEILKGGEAKLAEAGVALLGGHTVSDPELKYGFSITGLVHPEKILTNAGAKEGDLIVLTKALGTAATATALKAGAIKEEEIRDSIDSMRLLNKEAAILARKHGASGLTDVTGFGLLGHASEMAKASRKTLEIDLTKLPLLPRVMEFIEKGFVPGGSYSNIRFYEKDVDFGRIGKEEKLLLADPQTSGGLLVTLPEAEARKFLEELAEVQPVPGAIIGRVLNKMEEKSFVSFIKT